MIDLIKTYNIWHNDIMLDVVDLDVAVNTINGNKEIAYIDISVMYIDNNTNSLSYVSGDASKFEFIKKYC